MDMALKQLGTHLTALGCYVRALERADAAREVGILPSCFEPNEAALVEARAELERVREAVATLERELRCPLCGTTRDHHKQGSCPGPVDGWGSLC